MSGRIATIIEEVNYSFGGRQADLEDAIDRRLAELAEEGEITCLTSLHTEPTRDGHKIMGTLVVQVSSR